MIRQFSRWTQYRWGLALGGLLTRWAAWLWLGVIALGGDKCGLIYVDWELVLALATGIATIGVLWLEHKRANWFEDLAVEHAERLATLEAAIKLDADIVDRLARLEATSTDAMTVENRIAQLEARAERDEHLESRLAEIGERVAKIEERGELSERIARLEAAAEVGGEE